MSRYIKNITILAAILLFAGCSSENNKKIKAQTVTHWICTINDDAHTLLLYQDMQSAIYWSAELYGSGDMSTDGENIVFYNFIVKTNGHWIKIPKMKILYAKYEDGIEGVIYPKLHVTYQENISEEIYSPYNDYQPVWSENKTKTFVPFVK